MKNFSILARVFLFGAFSGAILVLLLMATVPEVGSAVARMVGAAASESVVCS